MADSFGKYDVYSVTGSIYCYPETNVLRNKFGITDAATLKKIESDITTIRQYSLLTNPIPGRFSSTHLCNIHKYLFGDIYRFAGHFRHEDIMKGSTRFISHKEIKYKLLILLTKLKHEHFLKGLDNSDFVLHAAYYFAELNYLHPFREGNGRSTREFMRQLFELNGYTIKWNAVSTDEFLEAMEASIYDTQFLVKVLNKCLIENTNEKL